MKFVASSPPPWSARSAHAHCQRQPGQASRGPARSALCQKLVRLFPRPTCYALTAQSGPAAPAGGGRSAQPRRPRGPPPRVHLAPICIGKRSRRDLWRIRPCVSLAARPRSVPVQRSALAPQPEAVWPRRRLRGGIPVWARDGVSIHCPPWPAPPRAGAGGSGVDSDAICHEGTQAARLCCRSLLLPRSAVHGFTL